MQALDEPVPEQVHEALEPLRGPIEDLAAFPGNPQQHDLQRIADGLRTYGQLLPLVVNRGTLTGRGPELIAGHGRVTVMRRHDWQRPAILWGDWTDEDARKLLNQLNNQGTPDPDEWLAFLLPAIDDFTGAGITLDEFEAAQQEQTARLEDHQAAQDLDPDPDDEGELGAGDPDTAADADTDDEDEPGSAEVVHEPEPDPITRRGDVWTLGPHRIMCGDATVRDDVLALDLDGVNLVCTDPPYCSGGHQETGRRAGSVGTTGTHKQIANDTLSTRGYIALVKSALSLAEGVPYAYAFTDWRMWTYLFDIFESCGFGVRAMIVWKKPSPGMGRGWRSQHELVAWGVKQTPPWDQSAAHRGNVLEHPRTGNDLHTTQKPESLIVELLDNVQGFVTGVYDPFGGSMTTLLAADAVGIPCRAMELDPGYCDTGARRWQERTGELPLRNGEPVDLLAP